MPSPSNPPRAGEKRLFFGWVIIAALFFIVFVLWGAYYTFGVFLKPMSEDLGWTRAMTSGVMTLGLLLGGVMSIVMGGLTDRYGPRMVLILGSFSVGLGYLLMYGIHSLWQLYVLLGVLVGLGMSTAYAVPAATAGRWFVEKRAFVLAITFTGLGIAQMTVPPLVAKVIEALEWRQTYLLVGVAVWVLGISTSLILKRSPEDVGLLPDGKQPMVGGGKGTSAPLSGLSLVQALHTPAFWLLSVIWLLTGIPILLAVVHIIPYATDMGIDRVAAATVMTFVGISNIVGRIFFGNIADRIGSKPTLIICLAIETVALLVLMGAKNLWGLYAGALLLGGAYSAADIVCLNVTADFFGRRYLGIIIGATGLAWRTGAAAGALLGGVVYDLTKSYSLAFLIAAIGIVLCIGLAFPLFAKKPKLEAA